MKQSRKISENVYWIGADDRRLSLFENLFPIPNGVSYNSYFIDGEKTIVMDTVDFSVGRQFLTSIEECLNGRKLDFIVVNHMEPDHCAVLSQLISAYANVQVVGNERTFKMIKQFFPKLDLMNKAIIVNDGEEISLGNHSFKFIAAPMVHWPEVMVTYDIGEKILFSADAFGTFGTLNGNIFSDESEMDTARLEDARRYYSNIVGKYGAQVQTLLKKAAGLEIGMICPLHGPVWRKDIEYIVHKYDLWSSYQPEDNEIVAIYGSMYGNTESAVNSVLASLADKGIKNISAYDVSSTDVSYLISEIFRCSHIFLACPTYNGNIYPKMECLLKDMKHLSVQQRKVAVLDNGSWAAVAGKKIKEKLEKMKDMELIHPVISVKSAVDEETEARLLELVQCLAESINSSDDN